MTSLSNWSWGLITDPSIGTFWFLLVVNVFAVFRLSRIVARDTILDAPRTTITERYHGSLIDLMLCMWCLSFWFAILATVLTAWDFTRDGWLVVATVLAISSIVGLLSEIG